MNFTHDLTTAHTERWSGWLGHLCDQPCTALEIGCFEGQSSIWFCQNILSHPESRLICVDTFQWDNAKPRFLANIQAAGVAEQITLKHMSSRWLMLPENHLDFAYVDGSHQKDRVLADAITAWRSIKPGGIIIFDDYLLERNGQKQVKVAVDAFLRVHADWLELIHQGRQVCIRRRP